MRIYYGSEKLKLPPSAVAMGDFDAIHKGHQAIILDMIKYAKENDLLSVVYMFASPPNKSFPHINTLSKRIEILEKLGVECCVIEEFTFEYKHTSCEDFVKEYIKHRLNAKGVFVGFNYRFGATASGDTSLLERLCKDTKVFVMPCIKINDIPVSSTVIREMIEIGRVDCAREFMGRCFSIKGCVVKGRQLGRTIGFPTANIEYPEETVVPMEGVYITRCKIGNDRYYSITNVGEKPTVMEEHRNIETAVMDFSRDIYGEEIEIEFNKYIRKIKKFDSLDDLKKQLTNDIIKAKEFFGKDDKNE